MLHENVYLGYVYIAYALWNQTFIEQTLLHMFFYRF